MDFGYFCDFEEGEIPAHSTLCRYRHWLIESGQLKFMLNLVNEQLEDKGLKIQQSQKAIVDASIIESAGRPQRQVMDIDSVSETLTQPVKTFKLGGQPKLGSIS